MTYFYKNAFKTFTFFLLVFAFSNEGFTQILPPELKCDGREGYENVKMSGSTSTVKDSTAAVDEYLKNVAGASKTVCKEPENCSSSLQCNKIATGGEFSTPTENDLGYWEFPSNTVRVKLKCACQTKKKVAIFDGDITIFPFDPLIDEDDTDSEDISTRSLNVDPSILIYPNPVQEDLKIDFNNFGEEGAYNIRIFNNVGTLMQTERVNISDGTRMTYDIKTSDYANGIYYLLVTDSSDVVTSSKFIVTEE